MATPGRAPGTSSDRPDEAQGIEEQDSPADGQGHQDEDDHQRAELVGDDVDAAGSG